MSISEQEIQAIIARVKQRLGEVPDEKRPASTLAARIEDVTPPDERQGWRGFQNAVYRSTFVYDAASDAVIIWYSGYTGNEWRTAVERVRPSQLVRRAGG